MKSMMCAVLVAAILSPAAALATQGTAVERTPEYWRNYAEKLQIGSTVNVRTTDGKRTKGLLTIVDAEGITIELKTRVPEPARRIAYGDIVQLEPTGNGGSVAKAVAIGAGIGAGTLIGFLMILAAAMD